MPAGQFSVCKWKLLELINSSQARPILEPEADLLGGGTNSMATSTEVINRIRVNNNPQTEHPMYKLANLSTVQFCNVFNSKLATLYAAVDVLPE